MSAGFLPLRGLFTILTCTSSFRTGASAPPHCTQNGQPTAVPTTSSTTGQSLSCPSSSGNTEFHMMFPVKSSKESRSSLKNTCCRKCRGGSSILGTQQRPLNREDASDMLKALCTMLEVSHTTYMASLSRRLLPLYSDGRCRYERHRRRHSRHRSQSMPAFQSAR